MNPPACVEHVISMPGAVRPVLALGAWFKNTVCFAADRQVWVIRPIGDLATASACRAHETVVRELLASFGERLAAVACDLHPDFHSTRFAAQLAEEIGVPLIAVQHHHAHIAAVCAEHGVTGPVLGLALDGVGLGTDGRAWGGELLRVDGATCQRLGHLRPLPMPGGDRAAQEPWRMAAAVLHELGRGEEIVVRFRKQAAAATVTEMLQRDLNCPRTSSMGRVFDAVAALLGLCEIQSHDAQAPMLLEQAAARHIAAHGWPEVDEGGWHISTDGQLDLTPLLVKLAKEGDAERGAATFHVTLTAALAAWVVRAARKTSLSTVVLAGGCFLNSILMNGLNGQLQEKGVVVLTPKRCSPGDASIALGQAWVAEHTLAGRAD